MSAAAFHPAVETPVEAAGAVVTESICKVIDDRPVLDDVNLRVEEGRFAALLGANGAGKSTLLKILATLSPATSGTVRLFGQELRAGGAKLRSEIGLIGHQSMLYRDLTARENLEFFGRLYRIEDPRGRAEVLLQAMGLGDRADDPVGGFSRGMAQRVAIARALLHRPRLLLADEPFDGLDVPSSRGLEDLLGQLRQAGRTIILVNHDIAQSLRMADRVVVLSRGRVAMDVRSGDVSEADVIAEMERP